MARIAITIAATATAATLCLAVMGCNSPTKAEESAQRSVPFRKASNQYGGPTAAHGVWLLTHGKLAAPSAAQEVDVEGNTYHPISLSSIHVPIHPSDPRVLRQAGWMQTWANSEGDRIHRLFDTDWRLVANLDSQGFLEAPNGDAKWGGRAFDVQEASKTIFGAGSFLQLDVGKYELSTTLKLRSEGRIEDSSPAERGIKIKSEKEVLSLRPMGSGELARAAKALSREEFYKREQERYNALRAERLARPESQVPKPGAAE